MFWFVILGKIILLSGIVAFFIKISPETLHIVVETICGGVGISKVSVQGGVKLCSRYGVSVTGVTDASLVVVG